MTTAKETTEPGLVLSISVKGEIVASNFSDFKDHAMERIEAINYELATDKDFGQAKLDIASLKEFETTLTQAEENMLAEMDSVYALITGSRELKEISATARLDLNAKVTARQREIREELIVGGINALEIYFPGFRVELETAIKGKRSLLKMREAIDIAVEAFNDRCRRNRVLVDAANEQYGASVVYGESDLMHMDTEALRVELERRVERHKDALEKAKLKEEADKAKALLEESKPKEEEPQATKTAIPIPEPTRISPRLLEQAEELYKELEQYPVSSSPTAVSAEEEMDHFIQVIKTAFSPVKEARQGLIHPENIEKAEQFANDLREAWGRFIS